ncbi:MAG: rhodanese-like domain-containing protein [Kiritimatiellales bacterium]|nr:rhodanese-like domain-containing protein [Kiritimatiellales bacterium]
MTAGDTAKKTLWLIFAAVILAAGINVLHPERIPWVEEWGTHVEAQAVDADVDLVQFSEVIDLLRDQSALLVDARSAEKYARGHIPGAVSIPLSTVADGLVLPVSSLPVVIYCDGPDCEDSLLLALELRNAGRADVAVFIGGMALWESELLAVEEGAE